MAKKLKKALDILNSPEFQKKMEKDIKETLIKEQEERLDFYNTSFHDTYNAIINEEEISFEQHLLFCDCVKRILLENEKKLVSVVDVDNETSYYFYKNVKVVSGFGMSSRAMKNDLGTLVDEKIIFKEKDIEIKKLTFLLNNKEIKKEYLYSKEGYVFETFSEYLFNNQLLGKFIE